MSYDVEELGAWRPSQDVWSIGIRLVVGPHDGPGEESFDITVCSVGWIADRVRHDGVFDGRHHLILEHFDWASLTAYLERRVAQCVAPTWKRVAEQLGRFGYWEFEDYEP